MTGTARAEIGLASVPVEFVGLVDRPIILLLFCCALLFRWAHRVCLGAHSQALHGAQVGRLLSGGGFCSGRESVSDEENGQECGDAREGPHDRVFEPGPPLGEWVVGIRIVPGAPVAVSREYRAGSRGVVSGIRESAITLLFPFFDGYFAIKLPPFWGRGPLFVGGPGERGEPDSGGCAPTWWGVE